MKKLFFYLMVPSLLFACSEEGLENNTATRDTDTTETITVDSIRFEKILTRMYAIGAAYYDKHNSCYYRKLDFYDSTKEMHSISFRENFPSSNIEELEVHDYGSTSTDHFTVWRIVKANTNTTGESVKEKIAICRLLESLPVKKPPLK